VIGVWVGVGVVVVFVGLALFSMLDMSRRGAK
jgi:hypothetical protein